jgi:hypothetical protein
MIAACGSKIRHQLEIDVVFSSAMIATMRKDSGRFMFMSASVAGPKITHAALVDIPRKPGSYEICSAIGTVVKCFFIHTVLTPIRLQIIGKQKVARNHGRFITNVLGKGQASDKTMSSPRPLPAL